MHYTSHRTVLPEHNARYENGDTLTLGDGTEWEYFEASGWVPVAVRPVTNPVTGGIELIGPSGDAMIVIDSAAPDDEDGRADGVIYIQTEA